MRNAVSVRKQTLLSAVFLTVIATGAVPDSAAASDRQKSARPPKVVLEVVNRHFTRGKKIPSLYLRVFSDGTAECHTVKYSNETDIAKKKTVPPEGLQKLETLIDQPELPNVKSRYELMHWVVDSWMEWEIKIHHSEHVQKIAVANFSPASAREKNTPYPDVLVKLGCSIEKLRNDVYGDAPPELNSDECKQALGGN